MHLIRRRLRDLAHEEDGFTLVALLGVMVVVSIFAFATFNIVDGDLRPGGSDRDRKVAYAAAEAGVNDYLAHLGAQPDYWKTCADDGSKSSTSSAYVPLNQVGTASAPLTAAARKWKTVPGSTNAAYSIELLPANSKPSCDTSDPTGTFVDSDTGTFRIRSTGRSSTNGQRRSLVATFRRKGFLDYIYYTTYEDQAPELQQRQTLGYTNRNNPPQAPQTQQDFVAWSRDNCARTIAAGRGNTSWTGEKEKLAGLFTGNDQSKQNSWTTASNLNCGEIQFQGTNTDETKNDKVLGPFHTEDEVRICGNVRFGRKPNDDIEVVGSGTSGTGAGITQTCNGNVTTYTGMLVNQPGGTATDRGTYRHPAGHVVLPTTNAALHDEALPAYRFVGRLRLRMTGDGRMTILEGKRENGTVIAAGTSVPMPTDGVIYDGNDTSASTLCPSSDGLAYNPLNPYGTVQACGDVWIDGTYTKSTTINAANDIIITDDIQRNGDVLLGLISKGWTRVLHPTTGCTAAGGGSEVTNTDQSKSPATPFGYDQPGSISIAAAILSVSRSFTVDSFWCGAALGTLTIDGAIAQMYRGPVATGSSSTGYVKNYTYDDRFRFRTPPRFLDPVQAAWRLQSEVEQVPSQNP